MRRNFEYTISGDLPQGGPSHRQGQSVFHNAQELEEFAGVIAKIAEGDGDFFAAGQAQQADGGVANGG
jgi:hypothetical protein